MPCNERVGKGVITYPCTLPDNHPGPHTSAESNVSQRERARWETDQAAQIRHAETGLAEFQGVAQTTAQRYTENPTKVPITPGRARLHQECSQVRCRVYDGEHSAWSECPFEPGPPQPEGNVVVAHTKTTDAREAYAVTLDRGTPNEEPVLIGREGDSLTMARGVPTKTREGDQVLPTGDPSQVDVQSLVIADVEARRQVGISRYGQAMQTFNGRDTLLDAYEEVLDLLVYLRALREMKAADRARLVGAVQVEMHAALGSLFQGDTARKVAHELAEKAVDRILDAL